MDNDQNKSKLTNKQKRAIIVLGLTGIAFIFLSNHYLEQKRWEPSNIIPMFFLGILGVAVSLYTLNISRRITYVHILFFPFWIIIGIPFFALFLHYQTIPFLILFIAYQVFVGFLFFRLVNKTPRR